MIDLKDKKLFSDIQIIADGAIPKYHVQLVPPSCCPNCKEAVKQVTEPIRSKHKYVLIVPERPAYLEISFHRYFCHRRNNMNREKCEFNRKDISEEYIMPPELKGNDQYTDDFRFWFAMKYLQSKKKSDFLEKYPKVMSSQTLRNTLRNVFPLLTNDIIRTIRPEEYLIMFCFYFDKDYRCCICSTNKKELFLHLILPQYDAECIRQNLENKLDAGYHANRLYLDLYPGFIDGMSRTIVGPLGSNGVVISLMDLQNHLLRDASSFTDRNHKKLIRKIVTKIVDYNKSEMTALKNREQSLQRIKMEALETAFIPKSLSTIIDCLEMNLQTIEFSRSKHINLSEMHRDTDLFNLENAQALRDIINAHPTNTAFEILAFKLLFYNQAYWKKYMTRSSAFHREPKKTSDDKTAFDMKNMTISSVSQSFEPIPIDDFSISVSDLKKYIGTGWFDQRYSQSLLYPSGYHQTPPEQIVPIRPDDLILSEGLDWQRRQLQSHYPIIMVNTLFCQFIGKEKPYTRRVFLVSGLDLEGKKEVLGFYPELPSKENIPMGIMIIHDLFQRGVKQLDLVCTNNPSWLEDALRQYYPNAILQINLRYWTWKLCQREKSYTPYIKKAMEFFLESEIQDQDLIQMCFEECFYLIQFPCEPWEFSTNHVFSCIDLYPSLRSYYCSDRWVRSIVDKFRHYIGEQPLFSSDDDLIKAMIIVLMHLLPSYPPDDWDIFLQWMEETSDSLSNLDPNNRITR